MYMRLIVRPSESDFIGSRALTQQLARIKLLKRKGLAKKVILAAEISKEIASLKSCITEAVSSFAVSFVRIQTV
jgi:hypothetical protein